MVFDPLVFSKLTVTQHRCMYFSYTMFDRNQAKRVEDKGKGSRMAFGQAWFSLHRFYLLWPRLQYRHL
jgi:hypothetical protein